MKRLFLSCVCLILVMSMLTGCFGGTKEYTCQDLTITVPSNMEDVSSQSEYSRFTFTLLNSTMGVIGIKESFTALGNGASSLSVTDYAKAVIQSNSYTATPITRDGQDYVYFTYKATSEGIDFEYVAGCFKGADAFWLVQAYAPASDFNLNEMLEHLDTVKIG